MRKLRDRISKGEIVVTATDKSGRLAVSSRECYKLQGAPHVAGDQPVGWEEVERVKSTISSTNRVLAKMFRVGEDWGEQGQWRVGRALGEVSTIIPQMSMLPKDHKPLGKDGVPKGRPVCSASSTINQRISDILTDILQGVASSDTEFCEINSTEDLMAKVEDFNQLIREGKVKDPRLLVGS